MFSINEVDPKQRHHVLENIKKRIAHGTGDGGGDHAGFRLPQERHVKPAAPRAVDDTATTGGALHRAHLVVVGGEGDARRPPSWETKN